MCIIIDSPVGSNICEADLRGTVDHNSDGIGYMYKHPVTGEFIVEHKLLPYTLRGEDEFVKLFQDLKNVHVVFHLRFMTKGSISVENCHPYPVLNKEEHGTEVWMMHNGTIASMPEDGDKSDSLIFTETIIRPMLAKNPSLMFEPCFHELVEGYIGSNNRLLLMNDEGKIVRLGKWTTRGNCIVSNDYAWGYSRSSTYGGANWGTNYNLPDKKATPPAANIFNDDDDDVKEESTSTAEAQKKGFDEWSDTEGYVNNEPIEEDELPFDKEEEVIEQEETLFNVFNKPVRGSDIDLADIEGMDYNDIVTFTEEYPTEAADIIVSFNDKYQKGWEDFFGGSNYARA